MENNKKEIDVLLYSCGLDSYLSFYKLKNKLDYIYYIDSGVPYNKYELEKLSLFNERFNDKKFKVLFFFNLKHFENTTTHFLPFRNLIYIFIVLSDIFRYYNEDNSKKVNLYIGGMKDDRVNDNNKELFDNLNNVLSLMFNNKLIEVKSVFNWEVSKKEALLEYFKNNYSIDEFLNFTFSCYEPLLKMKTNELKIINESINLRGIGFVEKQNNKYYYHTKECLCCKACLRKNVAIFNSLGIFIPFYNNDIIESYLNDKTLPKWRYNEILLYYNEIKKRSL